MVSIEIVVQLGGKCERHFPLEGLTVIAINAMIRFGCVAGVGRQNREEEGEGSGLDRAFRVTLTNSHQLSMTVNMCNNQKLAHASGSPEFLTQDYFPECY